MTPEIRSICDKEGTHPGCIKYLKQGLCPCVKDMLFYTNNGECKIAILEMLPATFCLIINNQTNKMFLFQGKKQTARELFSRGNWFVSQGLAKK